MSEPSETTPLTPPEKKLFSRNSRIMKIGLIVSGVAALLFLLIALSFPFRNQILKFVYEKIPGLAYQTDLQLGIMRAQQKEDGKIIFHSYIEGPDGREGTYVIEVFEGAGQTGSSRELESGNWQIGDSGRIDFRNRRYNDPGFTAVEAKFTVFDGIGTTFITAEISPDNDQLHPAILHNNCQICADVYIDPGIRVVFEASGFEYEVYNEWHEDVPWGSCWNYEDIILENPELQNGFDAAVYLTAEDNNTRRFSVPVEASDIATCMPELTPSPTTTPPPEQPSPTPTPTPPVTETPTPTSDPSATPTPLEENPSTTPTEEPTPTETPTPTEPPIGVPEDTPTPTPSPVPPETPTPTPLAEILPESGTGGMTAVFLVVLLIVLGGGIYFIRYQS